MRERRIALEQVGAVGDGAQGVPLEESPQDLGKAQGGDGQIVALQPQHRQSDQIRHQRRQQAAHQQRQQHTDHRAHIFAQEAGENLGDGELDGAAVKILVHAGAFGNRDGQHAVDVSAQQHEARLAQGKQAREAVQEVHGHSHQGIDRGLFYDRHNDVVAGKGHIHDDAGRQQNQQNGRGENSLLFCHCHVASLLTPYR